MKILFIHTRYQQKGGEDTIFQMEVNLLKKTEEVNVLMFENLSGFRGAFQFLFSIWNISAAGKIKKAIKLHKPQIIHVHNSHYAIGPLLIRIAKKKKIPIVFTVPNFRLLCPSATLLHKNALFLDSINTDFPWKAIRFKVYRKSYVLTFWLAFVIWFHKKIGTWKMTDRYILLTDLAKNIFANSSLGISSSQISVKPNFIDQPGILATPPAREQFLLFVGRLSQEKGIDILLKAFSGKKIKLYICGDGPLRQDVLESSKTNENIEYMGLLEKDKIQDVMCRCSALIFPSIWYEGMPMTIIEAFALGTPVIASNMGAMSSMITDGYNGFHFMPGNSSELERTIESWQSKSIEEKKLISDNAHKSFQDLYTPERNKIMAMDIYKSVIEKNIQSNN